MENNRKVARLRRITTLGLMVVVFVSSSLLVLAAPDSKTLAGEIIVSGNGEKSAVMLNGERAYSGRTFFSSGVISTPEKSSALINLGKLGRINLAPNSILSLSFTENSISGKLSAGQIKVFSGEGVSVNIETSDNVVTNNANQSGVFTVDVQSGVTQANAESGSISTKTGQTSGQNKDDDDDDKISIWIPILIFAGVVGAAAAFTITNGDNDALVPVSPIR